MANANDYNYTKKPKIQYVSRPQMIGPEIPGTPKDDVKYRFKNNLTAANLEALSVRSSPIVSQIAPRIQQSPVTYSNDKRYIGKNNKPSSPISKRSLSFISDRTIYLKKSAKMDKKEDEPRKSNSKTKIIIISLIIFLLIIAASVTSVLVAIRLLTPIRSLPSTSSNNALTSFCSTTTCVGQETPYHSSMVTVLYPFDGNFMDLTGYIIGTPFGSSIPGFTSSCYVGSQALGLNFAFSQYVQIPYVNLAQQSFTVEVWVYPAFVIVTGDYGIFSQCDSNLNCLSISLRNGRFALSFDSMNSNNTLTGSSLISINDWVHLTVVYDAVLYQQRIYVNGQIDAVSRDIVLPFRGTSSGATTSIGKSISLMYGSTYFHGRIDHFTISASSARTSCQIDNDATLTAYFPFDTLGTYNDHSVNLFNGLGFGTNILSQGRSAQALYFPSNTSYFQAQCFPSIETNDPPFAFSFWVYPAAPFIGGSLVHISNLQTGNGTYCYDLLVFTPTQEIVVQWMQSATIVNSIQGPYIPLNTWTHITVMFHQANGIRLYINGQLSAISSSLGGLVTYDHTNPQYVTLANNSPMSSSIAIVCRNGSIPIVSGPFIGAIDDFRIYSRELSNDEICKLANL